MKKVDLDALSRRAGIWCSPIKLALIERVRELEGALADACNGLGLREPLTEADARADAEICDRCLAILQKGTVLP